jgi:hypothetical protein
MILNDTLQKHQDCLEQCDLERTACEFEQEKDQTCEVEMKNCQIICDLDYGP